MRSVGHLLGAAHRRGATPTRGDSPRRDRVTALGVIGAVRARRSRGSMAPKTMLTAAALMLVASLEPAALQAAGPARIVSTSPSITETLFALGLGDRVVGVSTFCRFPPEATGLPKVGTFLKPDAELIAGLRPDLVVVHEVSTGIDRKLAALRLPFVVVERGTIASVFSSMKQIGSAAGVPDRAEALVKDVERRLNAIRQSAAMPRRRVLFIIGRHPGTLTDLVGIGPGSYLNDVIEIAGGINVLNITGQPEYPRVSLETVLRLDPEVIVDTVDMGETPADRRQRATLNAGLWAAYATLTAVKTGRLYAATTDALVVPGPRVVEAAEWVARLLRGGADR
jgi:iron complex transport system substrate-binding protein